MKKLKGLGVSKMRKQDRIVLTALLSFLTPDNQPHPSKVNPDHYVIDFR